MRIRATDEREQLWDDLKDATGESTKAGALDAAARHYLADKRAKKRVVPGLAPEQARRLSTDELPIVVENFVGAEQTAPDTS